MKKVALIGATGFVGSHILTELLSRGNCFVTAIARSVDKIKEKDANLKVVTVDIFNTDALADVLKGNDAVISAYNPGWSNPKIGIDTLNGYKSIIAATKKAEVKRLLMVGGAGGLLVAPNKMLVESGSIPSTILAGVNALIEVYTNQVKPEKNIDWVFFAPAATLKDGERTGKYRLGDDYLVSDKDGKSEISVQDFAKAMVDEMETPKHHQQRFTIGY